MKHLSERESTIEKLKCVHRAFNNKLKAFGFECFLDDPHCSLMVVPEGEDESETYDGWIFFPTKKELEKQL